MSSKYLCLLLSAGILLKPFSAEKRNDNSDPETNDRRGKQFSFFQVIQFPNEACNGTGTGSGTCYTGQECTTRNGASIGPCANGFGVCCAFSISCGGTSAENLTVFTDANIPTGMGDCTVRICPANDNICQLRLDFDRFQISGPSTITTSVTQIQNGQAGALGTENSEVSQCNMDRFEVSSGSGVRPPIICGLNTGQHVWSHNNHEDIPDSGRSSPFRAVFRSNGFEVTDSVVTPVLATSESTNKDNGVKLIYFQDSVN
eukprot:TCALIF_08999-PA protein Name:"Protein of unknown function" AED:0.18 eAED:0.18 QI:66/0.66/0.85/1/0.33/0.42/7/12/258